MEVSTQNQSNAEHRKKTRLMQVTYSDTGNGISLRNYADTIVLDEIESGSPIMAAIRFGGYPEQVKAMSDAIYGGGVFYLDLDGKEYSIHSAVKQYRREYAYDGLYAEATLLIQDDLPQADSADDVNGADDADDAAKTKEGEPSKPRKCYIFSEPNNLDQLFNEIDAKTAVPMIPAFRDYVLAELQNHKILRKLKMLTTTQRFEVWVLLLEPGDSNIVSVLEDGLHSGAIVIPCERDASGESTVPGDESMPGGTIVPLKLPVTSVSTYLNAYGAILAHRIKNQFNPRFDPSSEPLSLEILTINDNIHRNTGYSLYNAQLAVAEALKRQLKVDKAGLCVAECGSGKSKIGTTALHAHQLSTGKTKFFNIILCPSHLTKKWVREIEETLPNTFAVVIRSVTELQKVYTTYKQDSKTCYIVMSKEKARDSYMRYPAVKWNRRKRMFQCPDCGETVMMELINEGCHYYVPADAAYFRKEHCENHKCANEKCGSMLWSVLVPERQTPWVKVTDYGFVHREHARRLYQTTKNEAIKTAAADICDNPDGHFTAKGAYNRYALSTYIKKKMRGKIDGLILDELHQYANKSGQGDAMAELFGAAKKVIGMTATLINGYSSGIFYLLFRMAAPLMLLDDKQFTKSGEFNAEYGVTESVYEIEAPDYNSNRRASKRKVRERQLPGVSPLVYSRFLMEQAVFLSLNDMGKNLPEYEEFPIELEMANGVHEEYKRVEKELVKILQTDGRIGRRILSAYLSLLTVYPDQPYGQEPIVDPFNGHPLVVPKDTSSFEELHAKDEKVLELVAEKVAKGERVLIYTSWVRIDTQKKLSSLLGEQGYRCDTLTVSVPPDKREQWLENRVANGVQVLITNSSLVETGLDLNDFTTLIYYNIGYNLFSLRQSSRRSWRINQRAPRVEVYFLYYSGTMQHRAMQLMASKLAVAGVIEGNFTDEGLAAMSECQDMTTLLAQELTMGIQNEVEDLTAVFKKMAVLKPTEELILNASIMADPDFIPEPIANCIPETTIKSVSAFTIFPAPIPANATKKKRTIINDAQISLFDLLTERTA